MSSVKEKEAELIQLEEKQAAASQSLPHLRVECAAQPEESPEMKTMGKTAWAGCLVAAREVLNNYCIANQDKLAESIGAESSDGGLRMTVDPSTVRDVSVCLALARVR